MSTLTLTFTNFADKISNFLGYGVAYSGIGASNQARVRDIIQTGYRRFLTPPRTQNRRDAHEWSFLNPLSSIQTVAPYETGTLAIASGVVTLTGGTFPSWAAQGEFAIESEDLGTTLLTINTRDGNSQVTLDDLTINVTAGATYKLYRAFYDLPSDFAGFKGDHLLNLAANRNNAEVRIINDMSLRNMAINSFMVGPPCYASARPKRLVEATGQQHEMSVYPYSDAAYPLDFIYTIDPPELGTGTSQPLGGPRFSDVILEAMLDYADETYNDTIGIHHQRFLELLESAIVADERLSRVPNLGRDPTFSNNRLLPSRCVAQLTPFYSSIRLDL